MAHDRDATAYHFIGNALWLDFVNTEVIGPEGRKDLLQSAADVSEWLRQSGITSDAAARVVNGDSPGSGRALEAARAFRSILRGNAERISRGGTPGPELLAAVNGLLARRVHVTEIVGSEGNYRIADRWAFEEPDDFLVPIAESVRDTLVHSDITLIRKCKNPDCILYFLDSTKNHGRAWCSMAGCGNRTKVAAHYRRRREGGVR